MRVYILVLIVCLAVELSALPVVNIAKTSNSASEGSGSGSGKDELFTENLEGNTTDDGTEEDLILFEGDMVISVETLRKYYDIDEAFEKELMSMRIGSHGHHVSRRAATSDEDKLWSSKVVPYEISTSFTAIERQNILTAIETWSNSTCIEFVARSSEEDYVSFMKSSTGCNSHVGRRGGTQVINLVSACANYLHSILHEIGHALGLQHEHTRPDRDSYITIHEEKIQFSYRFAFSRRKDNTIDYQGTEYDYGSVMHYRRNAFKNCYNCNTVTVKNDTVYNRQGRPNLGMEHRLSLTDITQVRRQYKCPGEGQEGLLMVYIRHGVNLDDMDTFAQYVRVKAITASGVEYSMKTSHKQGTKNATWNERLIFSDQEWQFFRIRAWYSDIGDDDAMGMSVTVPLLNQSSTLTERRYCANTSCSRYVVFDYQLLPTFRGSLRVKVRYASNLPDTDPINLHVCVGALRSDGSPTSRTTTAKKGTRNPTWNTWLTMDGCDFARQISVQVFDADGRFDNELSNLEYIDIPTGSQTDIRHCVTPDCSSYLILDTEVILNRCERRLTVTANYGEKMPGRDRFGNSDPYVKVVAYDIRNNSQEQRTRTIHGTGDPKWHETLDFGRNIWTGFEVSVWDEDNGFDDRLSPYDVIHLLPDNDSVTSSTFTVNMIGRGNVEMTYSYV